MFAAACALLLAACPEPELPVCAGGFLGDRGQPVAMELTFISADGTVHPIAPCDEVPLLLPPQGGRVIFVGVRASNLDGCEVRLNAKVVDPGSGDVLGSAADVRTITLAPIAGRPGWGESSSAGSGPGIGAANFANIALCPNFSSRDVEQGQRLRATLTDSGGRTADAEVSILPRCPGATQAERASCTCECGADYNNARCADLSGWGAGDGGGCAPGG